MEVERDREAVRGLGRIGDDGLIFQVGHAAEKAADVDARAVQVGGGMSNDELDRVEEPDKVGSVPILLLHGRRLARPPVALLHHVRGELKTGDRKASTVG